MAACGNGGCPIKFGVDYGQRTSMMQAKPTCMEPTPIFVGVFYTGEKNRCHIL